MKQTDNKTVIDKNEYREAVIFILYKDGKILIEKRPTKSGGVENYIPNGGVEESDKGQSEDYKIVAMKREAREELNDLEILDYEYLAVYEVSEIKIRFYAYLVTGWDGEVPEYTIEPPGSGKKFADLEWIPLSDYKKIFTLPSALYFCERILKKSHD